MTGNITQVKKEPMEDDSFENQKNLGEQKKPKGEGVKLVGSPEELINLMITDVNEKKWATDQLINEGPKHKQVLSALLLKRLYKLVQTLEKSSNTKFVLQKGFELVNEKDAKKKVLPVTLPINLSAETDTKKLVEAVSHAPEHEALAYAMCLQVIDWTINTTAKK